MSRHRLLDLTKPAARNVLLIQLSRRLVLDLRIHLLQDHQILVIGHLKTLFFTRLLWLRTVLAICSFLLFSIGQGCWDAGDLLLFFGFS